MWIIFLSPFPSIDLQLNGTEATMTPQQQQTHTSIRLALSPYRPPVPMSCPAKSKVSQDLDYNAMKSSTIISSVARD